MKRVCSAQAMPGEPGGEIVAGRGGAIQAAKDAIGEDVEVIDSFIQNAPVDANPMWYLAKSIELLSAADIAYFAQGWSEARGCKIEHQCAVEYGVHTIDA